jgi:hypothetical protein
MRRSFLTSIWTKHSDWQALPQTVSKNLPICPICKLRTNWEVHDRYGWTTRGYKIVCKSCGAEWEYTTSKPQDMLLGGAFAAMRRIGKIADEHSIWVLKREGAGQKGTQFLGKEINFSTWKQMSEAFCGTCGNSLSMDEEFCPKCGTKKEDTTNEQM